MRIGQNPAKFVNSVPEPARVTAAIITYIPFLSGYYVGMLDVLQACLGSLWTNTEMACDLLVFDNASCPQVRDWLSQMQQAGKIQYLVLAQQNMGKAAAWNFIFGAAPGEIIAYADADIYFEPGWLTALVEVLDALPNAGMVTGMPMWSPAQFSTATTAWAEQDAGVSLERGKLLPWEDYWRHARSLGQDEATARSNFGEQQDIRIRIGASAEDSGQPAAAALPPAARPGSTSPVSVPELPARFFYAGAGHFQFVARKSVLQQVIPIPADRPMGQVRRLDAAINEAGFLRLSTPDWWVRHMGNTMPDGALQATAQVPGGGKRAIRGPIRRLIQWVYHRSFELLYGRPR